MGLLGDFRLDGVIASTAHGGKHDHISGTNMIYISMYIYIYVYLIEYMQVQLQPGVIQLASRSCSWKGSRCFLASMWHMPSFDISIMSNDEISIMIYQVFGICGNRK